MSITPRRCNVLQCSDGVGLGCPCLFLCLECFFFGRSQVPLPGRTLVPLLFWSGVPLLLEVWGSPTCLGLGCPFFVGLGFPYFCKSGVSLLWYVWGAPSVVGLGCLYFGRSGVPPAVPNSPTLLCVGRGVGRQAYFQQPNKNTNSKTRHRKDLLSWADQEHETTSFCCRDHQPD